MWFQYNLLQCRQSYSLLLTFSIKTLWRSDLSVINSGLVSVTSYNSTCRIKEIYFNCLSRLYWKDQNFYDVLVSLKVLKNPNHVVSMKKKMEIEVDCNAMTWLWCIICHNSYRKRIGMIERLLTFMSSRQPLCLLTFVVLSIRLQDACFFSSLFNEIKCCARILNWISDRNELVFVIKSWCELIKFSFKHLRLNNQQP